MASPRYRPSHRGVGRAMNTREMVQLVAGKARKGRRFAISISPRESGQYRASFEVDAGPFGGPKHDRAEARLTNDARYAATVEWRNNGGERVLGRTVDHIEHT